MKEIVEEKFDENCTNFENFTKSMKFLFKTIENVPISLNVSKINKQNYSIFSGPKFWFCIRSTLTKNKCRCIILTSWSATDFTTFPTTQRFKKNIEFEAFKIIIIDRIDNKIRMWYNVTFQILISIFSKHHSPKPIINKPPTRN